MFLKTDCFFISQETSLCGMVKILMKKYDFSPSQQKAIQSLLKTLPSFAAKYFDLILNTYFSLATYPAKKKDFKMMGTTLKELAQAVAVFAPYRRYKKVCLFGSARTETKDPDYELAEQLAKDLTEKDFMVVTGAGPGIMEAGNKGAKPESSFGLNIILPFEQEANPYIQNSDKLLSFKYFFTRKINFIRESHATVILPGGFGTLDEAFEVLTLVQTGRCSPRPIVLLSDKKNNYWDAFIKNLKQQLADKAYIAPEDIELLKISYSVEETVRYIQEFYSVYHSIRYKSGHALIKLNQNLSPSILKTLNKEFHYLMQEGQIKPLSQTDPLAKKYPSKKPRIKFKFNRSNYGGLCRLINRMTILCLKEG